MQNPIVADSLLENDSNARLYKLKRKSLANNKHQPQVTYRLAQVKRQRHYKNVMRKVAQPLIAKVLFPHVSGPVVMNSLHLV
tara:strand:+ start:3363 stop:3608 length:246 start_codon:yes stop_codon:yes gene_type:complete